jgi:phage head maturation protease
MPLKRCQDDDQPGWKWGDSGKCYTYTRGDEASEKEARKKAMAQAAAMGEFEGTGEQREQIAPLERRSAAVSGVNFAQRVITLVAVPYEAEATVEYRGSLWRESFERRAFDGIEKRPGRVKVNRDHDKHRLVGKAIRFWPSRDEGLVADVKISQTPLGDETLALADDEVLNGSVEFAVRGSDQLLDPRNMTRRIRRAYLGFIGLVPDPAYEGAKVLAVRSPLVPSADADMAPLVTPVLDEFLADDVLRWASERFQS